VNGLWFPARNPMDLGSTEVSSTPSTIYRVLYFPFYRKQFVGLDGEIEPAFLSHLPYSSLFSQDGANYKKRKQGEAQGKHQDEE
jgi:hypothetical protein